MLQFLVDEIFLFELFVFHAITSSRNIGYKVVAMAKGDERGMGREDGGCFKTRTTQHADIYSIPKVHGKCYRARLGMSGC